jgi:hypothetical protein
MIRQRLKIQNPDAPIPDHRAGIIVDRRCTSLSWEMREGYRWPEHKSDIKSESELPMDKDNHGPEALGRFVKGYFDIVGDSRNARQRTVRHKR